MSINRDYYVIAGYDLTGCYTDKINDWKWEDEGEKYFCNQSKGNIQLFDDPMSGEYLYLGYVLANGDEYCFETTKFDINVANQVEIDVKNTLEKLIDIGVININEKPYPKYQIIVFEECT